MNILIHSSKIFWSIFFIGLSTVVFSQTTQLRNDFCGATISTLGTNIFANKVTGAQGYRFRIVNQANAATFIYETSNRFFNLVTAGASPLNNQTYEIEVAVNMGSGFGAYGASCLVNTPSVINPLTQLRPEFCGATLASLGTNVLATAVPGATGYRFRFFNQNTGVTTVFSTTNRFTSLVTAGTGAQFNQTFLVDVAVNIGSGFGSYGSQCTVNTPVVVTPTTKIRNDFCGATISTLGSNIFADNITGAIAYRFRIFNVLTGVTSTYDRTQRWFNLISAGVNPQLAQEFQIDVAVNIGSGFGSYGDLCSVFTPHLPPTTIELADCGTTQDLLFYEFIDAVPNAQAEMYQFRIRNGNFESLSLEVSDPQIRFFDFPSFAYGTEYEVDVRMRLNNNWGPFGPSCNVSTVDVPYTQLQTAQFGGGNNCGATLSSVSSRIYAFGIPLIPTYKFRVTRNSYVDSIETNVRNFRLTDLPNFTANIEFGVPYTVEVALLFNGEFTEYGVQCEVFTPSPNTQLRVDFCGTTLSSIGQNIFADAVSGAQQYRFEINNGNGITEFTSNNRWFSLTNAGVAAPNTTYTVRVAIGVNGDFYPYGSACQVHTPAQLLMPENPEILELSTLENLNMQTDLFSEEHAIARKSTEQSVMDLKVSAFPNPTSAYFNLNLENLDTEEVQVRILTSTGAEVFSQKMNSSTVKNYLFGHELAPGVYFVNVATNKSSQTIQIVKN